MYVRDSIIPVEGDEDFPTDTSCDCAETQGALEAIEDTLALELLGKGLTEDDIDHTLHTNPPGFDTWVRIGSVIEHTRQ